MKFLTQNPVLKSSLRILLGILMMTAGTGHLTFQRLEFQAQVPDLIPVGKDWIVLASGAVEILLGLMLVFWHRRKEQIGVALAVFFILIFPGNIAQYLNGTPAFGLDTDLKRLIRLFFQPVLILWALWSSGALEAYFFRKAVRQKKSAFYSLVAADLNGNAVEMSRFEGKVIVVVNTASRCGFTPQYAGLENLYQTHRQKGLVILGFPCNQFGSQEPGSDPEIGEFCRINYGVSFPMFSKIDVNGPETHPVYRYLKGELPGVLGGDIRWNFTKFVLDRSGRPVKRFAPFTKPESMEGFLLTLLNHD